MVTAYRRNSRSMPVCAGLVLWVSAGINHAVRGFMDGWHDGRAA
jgi:hypothetical protein